MLGLKIKDRSLRIHGLRLSEYLNRNKANRKNPLYKTSREFAEKITSEIELKEWAYTLSESSQMFNPGLNRRRAQIIAVDDVYFERYKERLFDY